jgi:hypothetical protein
MAAPLFAAPGKGDFRCDPAARLRRALRSASMTIDPTLLEEKERFKAWAEAGLNPRPVMRCILFVLEYGRERSRLVGVMLVNSPVSLFVTAANLSRLHVTYGHESVVVRANRDLFPSTVAPLPGSFAFGCLRLWVSSCLLLQVVSVDLQPSVTRVLMSWMMQKSQSHRTRPALCWTVVQCLRDDRSKTSRRDVHLQSVAEAAP